MKEPNLNTIIAKSFKKIGFGHKISDPPKGAGCQRPFDGFSALPNLPIYYEAKLIKNGIYAFNFSNLKDHQIENLTLLNELLPNVLSIVLVGFYCPRKLFIVMAFDIKYINSLIKQGQKSLKKKELERFYAKGLFLNINYINDPITGKKDQLIDLDKLALIKDYIIDGSYTK